MRECYTINMKYYDTHFEEYVNAVNANNIHPELSPLYESMPESINRFENLIFHGACGIGKYSQVLYLLRKYSPSGLKYEKKITIQTEKQNYIYRISDIHYEIDISLLGCNSKILWHELFFQIVDIISVKQNKIGIIVCKNFHTINSELLEIFYSYLQQYNHSHSNITIKFILITEHISFIPSVIANSCKIINVQRPVLEKYIETVKTKKNLDTKSISHLHSIGTDGITNLKEAYSVPLINSMSDIPVDHFNAICDNIIEELVKPEKIEYTHFRDILYDILTYNLEISEVIWNILKELISRGKLTPANVHEILQHNALSLKYYNNNYRPIYHLESIMFYIINKIRNYDEL